MDYLAKLRRNITISYITCFFESLLFFLPIWYSFEIRFADPGLLSVIYAATYGITIILEIPTGALADLLGRKTTIIIGTLLQSLGWLIISQTDGLERLILGYVFNAVGVALVSGANTALIFDTLKELGKEKDFAKFNSKCAVIFRSGMIISTLAGGYIYLADKGLPYILVGICFGLSGLVSLKLMEPKIDTEKFSWANYINQTKLGINQLGSNTKIKWYSIYYLIFGGAGWYFLFFLNQSYATQVGFNEVEKSWIFSTIFLLIGIIGVISAKYSHKYRFFIIFIALITIGGYILGGIVNKTGALVSIFLVQLAGTMRFSFLDQYANDQLESKYRATSLSVLNMMVGMVFVALSLGLSKIITLEGAKVAMMVIGVISLLVGIPVTVKVLANEKD